MSTRGLVAVFYKGKYRIAQRQWCDAYPKKPGCGVAILEFLQRWDRDKFCRNLLRTWLVDDVDALPDPSVEEFQGMDALVAVADLAEDTPDLVFMSSLEFAANSLFCEWAYVIDLDTNTFEVYFGLNPLPVPHAQRFAELPVRMLYKQQYEDQKQYFQVQFLRKWYLRKLPLVSAFEATCTRLEAKFRRERYEQMKKLGRTARDSL